MDFRIADTFTDSLAKLQGDEQKAVKTAAFDLQMDPANPGMRFHKLDRAKDRQFCPVRVSSNIPASCRSLHTTLLPAEYQRVFGGGLRFGVGYAGG